MVAYLKIKLHRLQKKSFILIHLSRSFSKILGKNVRFFPQCPKISRKSWDFHRISLDFSYGLGIFLFFLCIYPKISGILGIAEKSPCLCPKRGLHFCLFPFIMIGQGFSACGGPLLRTNFRCIAIPAERFLCHRMHFPMTLAAKAWICSVPNAI